MAPTITLTGITCVGACAKSMPFMAGFGNYQVTGRTTAAPGTLLPVTMSIGGKSLGKVGTATVGTGGTFTFSLPVNVAGSVILTVQTPDLTASVSTAPQTVGVPAVSMGNYFSASTMKGTPVTGRLTTGMASRIVRLSVYRYIPAEKTHRWSYSHSVTTDSTGTFRTTLTYNRSVVGKQTWKAESAYANVPRYFSKSFTENKLAMIDFSTSAVTAAMVPVTYRSGCPVAPSQLTRISMNHFGFDGRMHAGHLIVRTTDVARFKNVFVAAFTAHFPMRIMKDPSPYRNDDTSMAADNTYAFFCRQVNGNPYAMSPHSYGRSVDINPVENPYRKPNGYWYPVNGRSYVDRSNRRPGMLFSDSPMTKSFLANGFKWLTGFDWQHFQVK